MAIPETKYGVMEDRDAWESIINSPDWIVFVRWIKGHIEYLEKNSRDHLRKHEDRLAGEKLAAADDWRRVLESIRVRLNELNNKIEQGGK